MEAMGRLARLAAAQDSVFTARDATRLGIDRHRLRRAETAGIVVRLHPQVFVMAGAPPTPRSLARAASLHLPHGSISHEAALVLEDVDRIPFAVAATVEPHLGHRHDGIRVHRASDLIDEHRTTIDGIPTTTVARAVVDVASVFTPARLEFVLDHVTVTRRLTSLGQISRTLRQVNRRGRVGIGTLSRLLDARAPSEPAPRSRLERRVDQLLLAETKLPTPRKEYPLPTDENYLGFVDRCWEDAMLILEIDGRTWHARERAMAKDRARDRVAARVGWQTLRILDEEVDDCPDAVVDDLIATYARRLGQLRHAS
jgi:Transcriptional regulator, AbiEi antitoxin/Protein of unknown function (DUF559)